MQIGNNNWEEKREAKDFCLRFLINKENCESPIILPPASPGTP